MKNILVVLDDGAGQEARLQAALDLTRSLDGHLSCFDIFEMSLATIEDRLADEDVAWSVSTADGKVAEAIARATGLADVIVVDRTLDGPLDPDMLGIPRDIVLRARKPMVAVSGGRRGFEAASHSVVAWDGSFPAMEALTRAVPLLRLASSVHLVEVQNDLPASVQDAAVYLSRYDIHADVSLVARSEADSRGPADFIQQICADEGAAYCVMGAYGNSRLREALFGGVTRSMLAASDIPLVLAH